MAKINDRRMMAMGRGRNQRPASKVTELVRHHTGVNVDQSMEILENYWKNAHGWDIGGYHEVIHPDGTVDLNYDPTTLTYGVGNHNTYTMHISLVGNGKFTQVQENAFDERALYHMKNLGIPVSKIKGHNEYSGHEYNTCPGINMNTVRKRLADALNKPTVASAKAYKVVTQLNGYVSSTDAKARKNAKAKVKAGTYQVFNEANGMINVTTKSGVPGNWINPNDNKAASKPVAPKPVTKKTYVQLAKHEPTWRAYRLGTKPVAGNQVGFLAPKQYGGLEYQILGYEDNGQCAVIQTQAFGKVKIYIKDPSAKILTK